MIRLLPLCYYSPVITHDRIKTRLHLESPFVLEAFPKEKRQPGVGYPYISFYDCFRILCFS